MNRNIKRPPFRPALLIIDMQNDYVKPGTPLRVADALSIIPNIRALLTYFREKKHPVFHILLVHRASGQQYLMEGL